MTAEMSYHQAVLQHDEYVNNGAYHRSLRSRLLGAYRYEIPLKYLPTNLTSEWSLDIGGGDGVMASRLAGRGTKSIVYDCDTHALQLARSADSRLKETAGTVRLPFPAETFKVITMLETLEHIPDQYEKTVVAEAYRTLKSDGTMVVSVPSKNIPVSAKHFRHYSVDELRQIFEESGFDDVQILPYRNLTNSHRDSNPIVRKAISLFLVCQDAFVRNFSKERKLGLRGCSEDDAAGLFVVAHKVAM